MLELTAHAMVSPPPRNSRLTVGKRRVVLLFVVATACAVVAITLTLAWNSQSDDSIPGTNLGLKVSRTASFKFSRHVFRDEQWGWREMEIDAETGHEIIRLLQGAERITVAPRWTISWDWPPVRRTHAPAPSFGPENGLLDIYEESSDTPSHRLGFLVVSRRIGHVVAEDHGRYVFPDSTKQRLFEILSPLVEDTYDDSN